MGCGRSGTTAVTESSRTVPDQPSIPTSWATKVECDSGFNGKKAWDTGAQNHSEWIIADHEEELDGVIHHVGSLCGPDKISPANYQSGFSKGSHLGRDACSPKGSPHGRRSHKALTFIPETTKEENLLLFDIVVCGQSACQVIEATCACTSAGELLRRRRQPTSDANQRCYCQTNASDGQTKHTVRLHFWSVVKFDDSFPELRGVDLQSIAVVFVPTLDNPENGLSAQLDELETRLNEIRVRMLRNGARLAMFCLPISSSGEARPADAAWRVEVDTWCSRHEVEMIEGVPTLDTGDRLYSCLTQSVASRLSESFGAPASS